MHFVYKERTEVLHRSRVVRDISFRNHWKLCVIVRCERFSRSPRFGRREPELEISWTLPIFFKDKFVTLCILLASFESQKSLSIHGSLRTQMNKLNSQCYPWLL